MEPFTYPFVEVWRMWLVEVISAPNTVFLPANALPGDSWVVKDGTFNASVNPITVIPEQGDIDGQPQDVIENNGWSKTYCWNGSNWRLI